MKSVMLSIQPKWCELIAKGKKTVEIRKTKPKIKTPFKCYIYCTKPSKAHQTVCGCMVLNDDELYKHPMQGIKYGDSIELMCCDNYSEDNFLNGKVIGEFVCDTITKYPYESYNDGEHIIPYDEFNNICLDGGEIYDYLGNQDGYGWHISKLEIYDKPKVLNDFYRTREAMCMSTESNIEGITHYPIKRIIQESLERAPQSWCYVEN